MVITILDPGEKLGARPYEMVWANRREPAPPTVRFDRLEGWTMRVEGGATATLQVSRAQNLWDRPVGRLRYAGNGKPDSSARVILLPPQPISIAAGANALDMWIYGNRFDYEPDPTTPPITIVAHLRDAAKREHSVSVGMRWKDWFLVHRKLPADMMFPVALESVEISGGWQSEAREIFLDSFHTYRATTQPLQIAPRPRRNLTPLPGHSMGANTGATKLAFPTREETILPMQMSDGGVNRIVRAGAGPWRFEYKGKDGAIAYAFDAARGLSSVRAQVNGVPLGSLLDGAQLHRADGTAPVVKLQKAALQKDNKQNVVVAQYDDGTTLRLRIWQKSLVVDVINGSGDIADFSFGQLSQLREPRVFTVPYLTYGNDVNFPSPGVLLSRAGKQWIYTSLWLDWYRSGASEPYGARNSGGSIATINGGVRYIPRTDGKRNPLFERFFVTVSPLLEEVLPTIANPVGLHAGQAVDRLWQESWGPLHSYEMEMQRSRVLRAYGIEKLIQNNHEVAWRDGGESFTLRLHAAPAKGGDRALQNYVAHQKSLGWLSGLYTNYTDFNTLNQFWNPDGVQRTPDGNWREAWARSYALKPLAAAAFEAQLAPQIKQKYGPTSAYTDVHTAVAPWQYVDYDARLPGAGSFAQTFYAYGELLRHDSHDYKAPIFSEGTYHWLYAGLDDGNYAQDGRDLTTEPLLPAFDLYQIHPKQCDIGMGVSMSFVDAIPRGTSFEGLDYAVDRYLLNTLAYGHIGYLVEERFSLERVCRSYYMLQQVQARYGLQAPQRIAYWDGQALRSTSQAILADLPNTRRQLYVEYPNGLKLWLNDHASEEWRVRIGAQAKGAGREITLPPAGWAAYQPNGVLSFCALNRNTKADYLRSRDYTYLDGRGQWFMAPEAASSGGLAIKPLDANTLQVTGTADAPLAPGAENAFMIARPYGVRGQLVRCEAFDMFGKPLAAPAVHDSGANSWIEAAAVSTKPVKWTPHLRESAPGGVRYVLHFSGKDDWKIAPAPLEIVPGGTVSLPSPTSGAALRWQSSVGAIKGGKLTVPANAALNSWIRLNATRGGQRRELWLRVVAPVQWRRQTTDDADSTRLTLLPSWNLNTLGRAPSGVSFKPSAGWTLDPPRVTFNGAQPPQQLQVLLRSDAPVNAEGTLQITLEGLPQPFTTTLRLQRTLLAATVTDLQKTHMNWGIARRGQGETPNAAGSGGLFQVAASSVGGVGKSGLYMHPPWQGGVGYAWAETDFIQWPDAAEFRTFTGLRDGGDASDGVIFRVELVDAAGGRKLLGEQLTPRDQKWHPFTLDLSAYAGQRVRLRLIADPGPADNTSADWAAWGEPVIQLSKPRLKTQVSVLDTP